MRKRSLDHFSAVLVIACATLPARSQDGRFAELRIEVIAVGASGQPRYTAELRQAQSSERFGPAELPPDGVWRFRDVPYGEYRLTILDGTGAEMSEQGVAVGPQVFTIMVRLPGARVTRSSSGTVSLLQLQNPVRKRALHSFVASEKLFDAGNYEEAAKQLENAIKTSPAYAEAYSRLAVVHIRMGLFEQATSEVSQALRIAGPNARDLSNKALAEYKLERYSDSMQSARSALLLDPDYIPAHYLLGVGLAKDRNTMAESAIHLERAAQTISSAKSILAGVQKALGRD